MWALFRTYNMVTDMNTMYSLIGVFDRYDIAMSLKEKYINDYEKELLDEWRLDPFNWGEKQGFPKVEKK
jgi:hypothetical protein